MGPPSIEKIYFGHPELWRKRLVKDIVCQMGVILFDNFLSPAPMEQSAKTLDLSSRQVLGGPVPEVGGGSLGLLRSSIHSSISPADRS